MTKTYTKKGDDGFTRSATGELLRKDAPLIEAVGTLDELSAAIGCVIAVLENHDTEEALKNVQHTLIVIAGELAGKSFALTEAATERLEMLIDTFSPSEMPSSFVVPGMNEFQARMHCARAICRRCERRFVGLTDSQAINPLSAAYLNRLSDLLFIFAEYGQ